MNVYETLKTIVERDFDVEVWEPARSRLDTTYGRYRLYVPAIEVYPIAFEADFMVSVLAHELIHARRFGVSNAPLAPFEIGFEETIAVIGGNLVGRYFGDTEPGFKWLAGREAEAEYAYPRYEEAVELGHQFALDIIERIEHETHVRRTRRDRDEHRRRGAA